LNASKHDNGAPMRKVMRSDDAIDRYFLYGIVKKFDGDSDVVSEQFAIGCILSEPGKTSERVAWKHAAKMTNNIPFVVILGGFYNDYAESLICLDPCSSMPFDHPCIPV
jgi:hypothetical protein